MEKKSRMDTTDPKALFEKIEKLEPNRQQLLILSTDPKWQKSMIDMLDPNLVIP